MSEKKLSRNLRIIQLLVSGAVIGFYLVRGFGLVGLEPSMHAETLGAGIGATLVGILKIAHWL